MEAVRVRPRDFGGTWVAGSGQELGAGRALLLPKTPFIRVTLSPYKPLCCNPERRRGGNAVVALRP